MKLKISIIILFCIILILTFLGYHGVNWTNHETVLKGENTDRNVILGDYDWELRSSDGRIDENNTIVQLKNASVNTYLFLIQHNQTDYEDLKRLLPVAQKEDIDIWVVLPAPGTRYAEPYHED